MTRIPSRHGQPLEPLEMSEADAVTFGEQIHSGFNGQAMWRRPCVCEHYTFQHHEAIGRCRDCACQLFREAEHESLVIELHPDAANYLPPGVYVIAVGNRHRPLGPDGRGGTAFGVKFILGRDLDSTLNPVLRGGVKEETTVWTSTPEGEETA